MAAPVFDLVAEELERRTDLEKLEARGTVRIALREAGLDPRSVTAEQMIVMLERVMPNEIEARGIQNADSICAGLIAALKNAHLGESGIDSEPPEAIFRRLARER